MISWTTVKNIWQNTPGTLQKGLVVGFSTLVVAGGLLLIGLVWSTGLIQARLEEILHVVDEGQQAAEHADFSEQQLATMDSVMQAHAEMNELELRMYLEQERKLAIDTAYRPLLRVVKQLVDAQNRSMVAQNRTDANVRALPIQFDEKLTLALGAQKTDTLQQLLLELKRGLDDQREEMQELRQELGGRKRSKPVRM